MLIIIEENIIDSSNDSQIRTFCTTCAHVNTYPFPKATPDPQEVPHLTWITVESKLSTNKIGYVFVIKSILYLYE